MAVLPSAVITQPLSVHDAPFVFCPTEPCGCHSTLCLALCTTPGFCRVLGLSDKGLLLLSRAFVPISAELEICTVCCSSFHRLPLSGFSVQGLGAPEICRVRAFSVYSGYHLAVTVQAAAMYGVHIHICCHCQWGVPFCRVLKLCCSNGTAHRQSLFRDLVECTLIQVELVQC